MTDTAPSTGALFRLRDLLDHHDLALEPLVAVAGAEDRRVSGVHAVETDRPARWLAPDWVLLTTGVRLVGDEDAQRRLPGELVEAGVTALGFGCGLDFDAAPEALLTAADDAGLPVFGVPIQTPFRDIEGFVHRALLSSELRTMQRLSSMQRYLVDALGTAEPRRTVVRRLATVLECDVAVLRPDGAVEEVAGDAPGDVGALLVDPTRGARDVAVGGRRGVLAPIAPDPQNPDDRWLLVVGPARPGGSRLLRPVVGAATPLLAAVGRLDGAAQAQQRALRRGLLEDLVAGGDGRELRARAAACGVDLARPARVAVVAPRDGAWSDDERERAVAVAARAVEGAGGPTLVATDRGAVVALLPEGRSTGAPEAAAVAEPAPVDGQRPGGPLLDGPLLNGPLPDGPLARVADAVAHAVGGPVTVGVGRPGAGAEDVRRGADDARAAAAAARDAGAAWRSYEALDLPALVAGQLAAERVAPQVDAVVAALDARPGSREALRAYFAHELDVTAAAQALHLHPNSLRYRLGRLADDLGRSLRDPWTIATLVLALEVERRAGAGTAGR